MSRVPPTPGPPIPPGGVPILGQPQQLPPTMHQTTFHGCEGGLYAVLGENNECIGYRLIIRDPREAHEYIFGFEQTLKDIWLKELANFPNIGEKPEGIEGNGVV